jgi:hypothetical protein
MVTAVMASTPLSNKLRPLSLLIWLLPGFAYAASDWKATTSLSLSETYSDNVDLVAEGAKSALITQVSPSITLSRQGKRGSATVTYGLNDLLYDSGHNDLTQALNASMQLEPVAGVFKVAGNAQVGQSYASQFGPSSQIGQGYASQSGASSQGSYTTNSNRVETRSASLTPSLHNEFFDRGLITDASLGLNYASAGSGALASSTSNNLSLAMRNGPRPERFTYSANYNRNSGDSSGVANSTLTSDNYNLGYAVLSKIRVFVAGGNNSAQGLNSLQGLGSRYTIGGVTWSPSHYFSLTGTAGQSDGSPTSSLSGNWTPSRKLALAASAGKRNDAASYSLSGNWTPDALTSLYGSAQKNFDSGTFGVDTTTNGLSSYGYTSYALNLNHRVRRAVVGLSYTESVLNAAQQINQTATFPYYLCGSQFQPVVQGVPMPSGCVPVSVLIPYAQLLNQTTYNKTWAGTLSFSLGRSAFSFSLSQSRVQSLGDTGGDSRQTGVTANWSLPISGRSSTSLGLNWSKAHAASTGQAATQQSDSWSLYWALAHQISPRVTSSLNAHHSEQTINGASGDIKENAVTAQLGMTF